MESSTVAMSSFTRLVNVHVMISSIIAESLMFVVGTILITSSTVAISSLTLLVNVHVMVSSTVAESDGIKSTGAITMISSTVAISSFTLLVNAHVMVSSIVAESLIVVAGTRLITSSTNTVSAIL